MNSNVVVAGPERFSPEQKKLILDTCCSGASESEARALMAIAEERGLNPLLQECYFVQRWDSDKQRMVWAVQASIDSFRIRAEASGVYDGQDEPEFEYDKDGKLLLARVKVWRKDWSRPSVGVARFSEYVQKKKDGSPTKFWLQSPHNQIAKCAEALAFRKAFPKQLSKIYTKEESGATGESAETDGTDPGDTSGAAAGFKTALLNASNNETLDLISRELKEAIARKAVSMEDAVLLRKLGTERRAAIEPKGTKSPAAGGIGPSEQSPNGSSPEPVRDQGASTASAVSAAQGANVGPGTPPPARDQPPPAGPNEGGNSSGTTAQGAPSPAQSPTSPPADGPKEPATSSDTWGLDGKSPPGPTPPARDWAKEGQELWNRITAATTLDALTVLGDAIAEAEKAGAPSTKAIRNLLAEKMAKLEPPAQSTTTQDPIPTAEKPVDWPAQEKVMEGFVRSAYAKGAADTDKAQCDALVGSFMRTCPQAISARLAKMLREAKAGKLEPEVPFR